MDFQAIASHTSLWHPERKIQIVHPRSGIQVHTRDVSPCDSRNFQTELCSLEFFYRENWLEQPFGGCFAFPCECGTPTYGHSLKKILPLKIDFHASTFQAESDSQVAECEESYLPLRKERHPQRVCLQTSILQEILSF